MAGPKEVYGENFKEETAQSMLTFSEDQQKRHNAQRKWLFEKISGGGKGHLIFQWFGFFTTCTYAVGSRVWCSKIAIVSNKSGIKKTLKSLHCMWTQLGDSGHNTMVITEEYHVKVRWNI